jgi:osmotically-inducible protein OsmY
MTTNTDATSPDVTAPDNTAVNERDADGATKTPIDQDETQADVNTTAEIRKRIVAADGMSINGQNVKVITAGGKVTLRGPVDSDSERETIDRIAREVAGDGNVDNQLEVATGTNP